jgi:hypothetical protein
MRDALLVGIYVWIIEGKRGIYSPVVISGPTHKNTELSRLRYVIDLKLWEIPDLPAAIPPGYISGTVKVCSS